MRHLRSLHLVVTTSVALCAAAPSFADTAFPLTVQNCGVDLTFDRAPENVVTIGQAATEILYALGLGERVSGTSLWFTEVLPEFRSADEAVERLSDNEPSFERVVSTRPGLVAAQFEWAVGPQGAVGTREQFADIGIPSYVLPADCVGKDNSVGVDGTRIVPYDMEGIYRSISELAAIFNVPERGQEVIADLAARERSAIASAEALGLQETSAVFWFSSAEMDIDPYVAGNGGAPAWMMASLGVRNVIDSPEEWPVVSWETIARANPTVIILARMDRRRYPGDDVENKLAFLRSDPVASQMDAVRNNRIVIIDAHAMDPSIRNIAALEELSISLAEFDLK